MKSKDQRSGSPDDAYGHDRMLLWQGEEKRKDKEQKRENGRGKEEGIGRGGKKRKGVGSCVCV